MFKQLFSRTGGAISCFRFALCIAIGYYLVAFVVLKILGLFAGTTLARKVMFSAVWSGWHAGVVFRLNMSCSANITLSGCVFAEGTTVGNVLMAEVVLQGVSFPTLLAFAGCFAVVCHALSHRLVA